jgi:hypothetical protein
MPLQPCPRGVLNDSEWVAAQLSLGALHMANSTKWAAPLIGIVTQGG